jgi:pimeloyl-ACP methyl ester carboxylesterase
MTNLEPRTLDFMSNYSSVYVGSADRLSAFDLTYNALRKIDELVIFCHGYKGFKDWGPWDLVGEFFAERGLDFLKFNFSHNGGTVENPMDFPDEDAFAKNTYSKELNDLGRILDLVKAGIEVNGSKRFYRKIYLIGHSRGGGIAVLASERYKTINKLATWAAVADFGERFQFDLNSWKTDGVAFIKNGRTGQMLPHNYSFYQDFLEHEESLNISEAAKKLSIPWLIAHAQNDEAVSLENAKSLHKWNKRSKLIKIEQTGHTFGGSHPWEDERLPEKLDHLCERTFAFFKG